MLRLALATSSKYPHLTADDRLLLTPLAAHGIQAEPAVWNNAAYDWSACAAVVIRSCWDYHLQPHKFLAWIQQLESANIPIFNPAPLLRWNANKSYLRDLDSKGVPIVPTFWPEEENPSPVSLSEKLRDLGWRHPGARLPHATRPPRRCHYRPATLRPAPAWSRRHAPEIHAQHHHRRRVVP